ncbi:hypothetical protein [Aquibium oceanicum]|uniref:Uncharacterized protein n=1 Tax=Aquibium oceanicum TaxID=1670800 RepID=A0A1L3SP14_9HYPH|nr:hypothetical protein [Aquibium oceanicum]APH71144.1 hypothetical protein BSQ44_06990 [Aquibium oceanicum]
MTLQETIDEGYTLHAACHENTCLRTRPLDLIALRDRLGPDHGTLHKDLAHKLRCSKCGSKNVGLLVSPPTWGQQVKGEKVAAADE